jgi:hypothetical protein
MATRIILRPTGIYQCRHSRRDDASEAQKRVDADFLILGWSLPVAVEGATVGDVLCWVRSLPPRALNVLEQLADVRIAPFLAELDTPVPIKNCESPITAVKVGKTAYIHSCATTDDGPLPRLDLTIEPYCIARQPGHDPEWFGLDFIPVADLQNATISIEPLGDFHDFRSTASPVRSQFDVSFRLGELLRELFTEICFYGTPVARDATVKHLSEACERVEAGTAPLVHVGNLKAPALTAWSP